MRLGLAAPVHLSRSGTERPCKMIFILKIFSKPRRVKNSPVTGVTRVPGLGQITLRIVLTKKMRGHLGIKLHGNREIAGD